MHSSQAASAGQRDTEAVNFLEKKMKNNPSLPFQETIQVRVFLFLKSGLNEGMQHIWVNKDLNNWFTAHDHLPDVFLNYLEHDLFSWVVFYMFFNIILIP